MATDFNNMGVQDMMKLYYCKPLDCKLGAVVFAAGRPCASCVALQAFA